MKVLVVRAREIVCAIPIAHVVETMRPLALERLGDAAEALLGVAIIRGVTTPVLDLGALLGGDAPPAPTRYVTLRVSGRVVALAVEDVVGPRDVDDETTEALPPLFDTRHGFVEAMARLDGELVRVLHSLRAADAGARLAAEAEPAPRADGRAP